MDQPLSVREAKARLYLAGERLEEAIAGPIKRAPKTSVLVALGAGILAGRLPLAKGLYKGLRMFLRF